MMTTTTPTKVGNHHPVKGKGEEGRKENEHGSGRRRRLARQTFPADPPRDQICHWTVFTPPAPASGQRSVAYFVTATRKGDGFVTDVIDRDAHSPQRSVAAISASN
jgi:hypothetical protein